MYIEGASAKKYWDIGVAGMYIRVWSRPIGIAAVVEFRKRQNAC